MSTALPTHAQVIVIGGGLVGCSTAYHLTKAGFSDVLVLERKELGSGTTFAAAGRRICRTAATIQPWSAAVLGHPPPVS